MIYEVLKSMKTVENCAITIAFDILTNCHIIAYMHRMYQVELEQEDSLIRSCDNGELNKRK